MTVNKHSTNLQNKAFIHKPKSTFGLSWRFLIRDWRSGELWLLVAALLMAVAVSTAIALFSERLQLALGRQVAEVLGADMLIRSPRPVQPVILEEAKKQGFTVIHSP